MQKSKHKLILFSLLALSVMVGVLSWHLGFTHAGNGFTDWLMDLVGEPIAMNIGAMIVEFCKVIYAYLVKPIVMPTIVAMLHFGISKSDILINGSGFTGTDAIWRIVLGIANGIYLLALFIASVAIILRVNVGMYNIKKFLGGFITAVILSNLSLYIVRAIWSIGELLVNALLQMATVLTPAINTREQIELFLRTLADQVVPSTLGGTGITFATLIGTAMFPGIGPLIGLVGMNTFKDTNQQAIISFVVLLVCVWLLIKLALVLFERVIRLFLLAVTAPAVFALGLLPNFAKLTSQWWENLLKWVLVWPAVLGLIIFSAYMFSFAGIKKAEEADRLGLFITPPVIEQVIDIEGNGPNTAAGMGFLGILLGLFALWSAGTMNKTLNLGSAIAGHVETPMKALQTGQGLYKKGADILTGKAAGPTKTIQDTLAGRNLVGMGLVGAKNQAMAGSYNQLPGGLGRAGKWARTRLLDIEAKRQSTTTGLAGAFFNPVGRGAKMEAEKKLKLNKKIVGIKTGETRQTLEALDAVSPGGDYLGLSDEERDKIKTSHPELAERYKQQEAELVWRGRQAFKEEDIHDFPLPSTLQKKVETGAEKNAKQEDAGEAVQAYLKLLKLASSRRVDQDISTAAKAALATLDGQGAPRALGLDGGKYRKQAESDGSGSGTEGARSELNAADLVSALSHLTAAIAGVGGLGLNNPATMDSFSETTKNTDMHSMAIALRKLSTYGLTAGASKAETTAAIDKLASSGGEGADTETVGALRKLVAKELFSVVGSLAGTAHTADEGGLGTMDALINNLQTIQNVANLSADITPETIIAFQTSITDYVTGTAKEGTKEGTGDSQAVFAELKSAIGESIESVAKGEDTAVDQQHNIEILLQAFGGKLIGETIGGDTITADNITVQQLTDLLAKAFTAISKM